ncbi:Ig-like domain-containing protein [Myxococcus sp. RHSTA-1-4]|uniref:Ig-like domain-containing protein n=1 Tax=Myxococcus sp. RHSTA-1-4 TaxID=2874601 RepID=UPI001CBDB80B|nr:Ig-like domain-containing protein [Myxococcus sp. RHSTA-1-4]
MSISLLASPAGVVAQPVTISSGATTATLRVSVSTSAEPGSATLVLRATSGNLSRDVSITLNIVRAGDLLVRWVSPSGARSYVNGTVALEAAVEGGTADAVELRNGSELLARLTAPRFTYTWDTNQVEEGEHHITAYAIRGTQLFPSFERTVVVDRTAPRTETRTPAQREVNVSARAIIEVTFSEPLKTATVTAATVALTASGGVNVEKAIALSEDGRRLTLTPATLLPAPGTMTVHLGTSGQPVTDLAGNPLVLSEPWTFTVPDWLSLGGAISAHPGATPAENVVMKLDSTGKPVIAWSEFDGTAKNVHVAQWNGETWVTLGSSLSALPSAGTDADNPALIITPSGNIVVAWNELLGTGDSGQSAYARTWTNGTWTSLPTLPISGASGHYISNPALAVTQQGTLYLYTTYNQGGVLQVRGFSLASNATSWDSLAVNRPATHAMPGIGSLASQGTSVFAAYDAFSESAQKRVIGVLKNHTQSLGIEIASSSTTTTAEWASIAVNEAGEPLVAWEESTNRGSDGQVFLAQWLSSSWQTPVLVSNFSTANSRPSLAVGDDGRAVIAWSGFVSPERSIYVSRQSGALWERVGAPLSAAAGASTPGFVPSLVLDRSSLPIVAWHETDGSTSNIYVRRYNQ